MEAIDIIQFMLQPSTERFDIDILPQSVYSTSSGIMRDRLPCRIKRQSILVQHINISLIPLIMRLIVGQSLNESNPTATMRYTISFTHTYIIFMHRDMLLMIGSHINFIEFAILNTLFMCEDLYELLFPHSHRNNFLTLDSDHGIF